MPGARAMPAALLRLRHVIRKEFLQLRHDRRMIPMLVVAPVLQLVVLGFAANLDVTEVPFVLVDHDRTAESRDLTRRFTASGWFLLVGDLEAADAIDPWLLDGRAQMALVIDRGFGEAVAGGRTPRVQILVDGSEANSAGVALGYATSIVNGRSRELVDAALRRAGAESIDADPTRPSGRSLSSGATLSSVPSVELRARVWYNPDLRSRWFYVPAILAMVMMLTTMILPSMAVVREKEIGTLEQLMVTPLRSWELMVGKLLPFGILGMITLVFVTGLTVLLFGVPLRGSFALLMAISGLFLLTTLGLGLLVSTLVRNQQQAMMSSVFVLMVPMIYLSGLIFPIENMPSTLQVLTYAIPLRYYNEVLRGIFLRGSGAAELWPQALALLAYGTGIVAIAAARFRKRLD